MIDLQPYIRAYTRNISDIREKEGYKWTAFQHFRETFNINATDFRENLKSAFAKRCNLLDTSFYYPLDAVLKAAKNSPELSRKHWKQLYDENQPLEERVAEFQTWHAQMSVALDGRETKNADQDSHAISVYLSMRYPEKYFIYGNKIYKNFAKIVGFPADEATGIELMLSFQPMVDEVRQQLAADDALIADYRAWLTAHDFKDDNLNLIVQDFIYAVCNYLTAQPITNVHNKNFETEQGKCLAAEVITDDSEPQPLTLNFKPYKADYIQQAKDNQALGLKGEQWVCRYEQVTLLSKARADLAKRVANYAVTKGDGLGYDIFSFYPDGKQHFIEVKTTTGPCSTPFFVTRNELEFSRQHPMQFSLYRLYDFDEEKDTARLKIINGSLERFCTFPTQYAVKL